MSLLPNSSPMLDHEFADFAIDTLDTDYSMLQILPMQAKTQILPHLAVMFDVNILGLSEEEARKYLHNALEIHRYKGTVYAVKKAIDAVFEKGELVEWFDADLAPGLFDVEVQLAADFSKVYTLEKFERARKMINDAKNVRCHLNDFIIELPLISTNIKVNSSDSFYAKPESEFEFIANQDIGIGSNSTFYVQKKSNLEFISKPKINIQGGFLWLI